MKKKDNTKKVKGKRDEKPTQPQVPQNAIQSWITSDDSFNSVDNFFSFSSSAAGF